MCWRVRTSTTSRLSDVISAWAMRWLVVVGPLFGLVAGCADAFGTSDAHHPGEPLGTFHVTATLTSSTCGEGALGSADAWAFDVKLSRGDGKLLWDNGRELVGGSVSEQGAFALTSGTEMDMRTDGASKGLAPCSIARRDEASGTLDGTDDDVTGFHGALSYAYAPTPSSSCADLTTAPTLTFAQLPCAITYAMTATRTVAPE
jgi:hypothetical protein